MREQIVEKLLDLKRVAMGQERLILGDIIEKIRKMEVRV
jgi:hypothetical protein